MKLSTGIEIPDPPNRKLIEYSKWYNKYIWDLLEHNRVLEARGQHIKKIEERTRIPEVTRNRMKKAQDKRDRKKEKIMERYVIELDTPPEINEYRQEIIRDSIHGQDITHVFYT